MFLTEAVVRSNRGVFTTLSTSKMDPFAKIFNGSQRLTIFAKKLQL